MPTSIRYNNFDGLANFNTSDFLMKDNELAAGKNVYTNKIGELEKVPGYAKADASQVIDNQSVNFLHTYHRPTTATDYLIAGSDSGTSYILEYRTTGAWTTLSGATYTSSAGAEMSAANYLDRAFVVGHDSGTFLAPATIAGTTYTTSSGSDTSLTDMPKGKYIVNYRDLLYVLNVDITGDQKYPSRAYYSDEPTAGEIGWTTPTTSFVDFGYEDGDEITGGAAILDRLIVFKHNSMWRYDEYERKQIAPIGCDSYRSIVAVQSSLYWFNRDGFWRWSGGYPELISFKMQPMIDAIVQTTLGNVVATVHDGFEYRAFVGDVTFGGNTYTNTWFCFDTRTEKQYLRCTADVAKSAVVYTEESIKRAYFGNDDGFVMKFAKDIDAVYADNGNPIASFFTTKAFDYGEPENTKTTSHLTFFSENPQGMRFAVEKDNSGEFKNGQGQVLKKNIESADVLLSGHRHRYKFSENGTNKSWRFYGFVIEADIKETEK